MQRTAFNYSVGVDGIVSVCSRMGSYNCVANSTVISALYFLLTVELYIDRLGFCFCFLLSTLSVLLSYLVCCFVFNKKKSLI